MAKIYAVGVGPGDPDLLIVADWPTVDADAADVAAEVEVAARGIEKHTHEGRPCRLQAQPALTDRKGR